MHHFNLTTFDPQSSINATAFDSSFNQSNSLLSQLQPVVATSLGITVGATLRDALPYVVPVAQHLVAKAWNAVGDAAALIPAKWPALPVAEAMELPHQAETIVVCQAETSSASETCPSDPTRAPIRPRPTVFSINQLRTDILGQLTPASMQTLMAVLKKAQDDYPTTGQPLVLTESHVNPAAQATYNFLTQHLLSNHGRPSFRVLKEGHYFVPEFDMHQFITSGLEDPLVEDLTALNTAIMLIAKSIVSVARHQAKPYDNFHPVQKNDGQNDALNDNRWLL